MMIWYCHYYLDLRIRIENDTGMSVVINVRSIDGESENISLYEKYYKYCIDNPRFRLWCLTFLILLIVLGIREYINNKKI